MHLERSVLRLLGEDISVECHLHRSNDPAHIRVDAAQLTQIILNLAVNARDAMPNGGRLTLGTARRCASTTNSQPGNCADPLAAGEYALISITDDGAGMSEKRKRTSSSRSSRPKTPDAAAASVSPPATASCVKAEATSASRAISAEARWYPFTCPRSPRRPHRVTPSPASRSSSTGTETILVLEDDVSVRHISVRVLRALGYDVLEAANGDDAQRLITFECKRKVDLLLTDMVMPQMSGRDFADWLGNHEP
ncbi:MAG: response regulator [Geodermatophilaceae bacterium]